MAKHQLENLITNCNTANQTKCVYCKRNKTCKEYNELLEINEIQSKDDWEEKRK